MDVKTMTDIITAIEGYFAVCDGFEDILGTNCSEPTDDSPFYKFTALFEIVERFTTFDIRSNEGGQKMYDVLHDKEIPTDKKARMILGLE